MMLRLKIQASLSQPDSSKKKKEKKIQIKKQQSLKYSVYIRKKDAFTGKPYGDKFHIERETERKKQIDISKQSKPRSITVWTVPIHNTLTCTHAQIYISPRFKKGNTIGEYQTMATSSVARRLMQEDWRGHISPYTLAAIAYLCAPIHRHAKSVDSVIHPCIKPIRFNLQVYSQPYISVITCMLNDIQDRRKFF